MSPSRLHATCIPQVIVTACIVPDDIQDRFATGRSLPQVDEQQDWILEAGEQEDGYTVLAFRRNLVTCDELFDREIQVHACTTCS